ncbi:MAG TPA: ABC transporter permease [Candidatus Limnocylindria bacterium]|nr:ABC transporter permease [Candidatus Limnocylindria bacterium]
MGDVWRSLVRVTSFLGKELRETLRRPGILFTLVLGPFLVMLLFGLGYTGVRKPFATELVIPASTDLPTDAEFYEKLAPGRVEVVAVGSDQDAAEQRLRDRATDLLVVVPENATDQLREGKQAEILVAWNQVDPIYDQLAGLAVSTMVSALNTEIIKQVASEGIDIAQSELGPRITNVSPEVIAQPTTATTKNIAPSTASVLNFFAPAVLALVIQHLAVTLSALSLVRERLSGQMDLFRVAPVSAIEVLIGKYLAYALLSLVATAAVGAAMVYLLGVPLISGFLLPVAIILLLTFAGLGIGLLISLVADSERMAVQLAMLVLVASVFFSGFVLPVHDFIGPVQAVSYALPVTHAIALLQDAMLRGQLFEPWMLLALAGIGLALFFLSLARLSSLLRSQGRRESRRRLVPIFGARQATSEE